MYSVSLIYHMKEFRHNLPKEEALELAKRFWYLSPIVRDSEGKLVLSDDTCSASRY